MREYIGQKITIVVDGFPQPVTGIMVNEDVSHIHIKSETKGNIWHIPKQKLSGFTSDIEPAPYIPFLILFCDNENEGCLGVQYVKEGSGFSQKDFDTFTGGCPCKGEGCRMGSKGELRSVSGEFLRKIFAGMLFGDYPEKKKEAKRGNTSNSGRTSKETQRSPAEGRRVVEGKESVDRGTGQPAEKT
jgi:hypothetical protein